MAYNPYFPASYQPNFYGGNNPYWNLQQMPQLQQPAPQQAQPVQQMQQVQQVQQAQPPAIQQSGFVSVPSMAEVHAWPVAPGNSVTFYVETTPPILATKTKGFSQLESPVVKEFDLVEKQARPAVPENSGGFASLQDLEAVKKELADVRDTIDGILAASRKRSRKSIETEGGNYDAEAAHDANGSNDAK